MKMFLFDRNQQVRRWLKDDDFIEATLVEQINATGELTFSLPYKKSLAGGIFFAGIPSPRGDGYLLFKLIKERKLDDRIEYQGIEAAYDELRSYHYIKDVRPKNESAGYMLQRALEGTRWQAGVVYGNQEASTNFYYISTLEAIQKIVQIFGVEVTFTITLDPKTNRITRRQVNLYAQQGERTGKRFEYGSNLLSVTREEASDGLVTALIGRGKGEQVSEGQDGSPDGYGRRIDFTDIVWSTANGNPVDKPAGQEYVEDKAATARYGFDDGKPRIGLQIFEDITDKTELLKATWAALQTLKRPKVSFKADVLDVGALGLGDTVAIIRHDLQIEYFTRVYKVTHNLLNERLNTIELGDDFSSDSITRTVSTVAGAVRDAQESANQAAISANGKNTNFYGPDKPANPKEGDLWYKDLGNGETDMYQYHNGNWVLLQSTRQLDLAKKEIDEQLKIMEARVKQASHTDLEQRVSEAEKEAAAEREKLKQAIGSDIATEIKKVNDTVAKDKSDLTAIISQSKEELTQANQQYTDAIYKRVTGDITNQSNDDRKYFLQQLDVTKGSLTTAITDNKDKMSALTQSLDGFKVWVQDETKKINTTITADVSGLQAQLTSQDSKISQLRLDTNGLSTKVGTLNTSISQLQQTDKSIQASVGDANGKISKLQVDLNGLNTLITNNKDQIAKFSADLNGVRSLVTSTANDTNTKLTSYVNQKADEWKVEVKRSFVSQEGMNLLPGTGDWSGKWQSPTENQYLDDFKVFDIIKTADPDGNWIAQSRDYQAQPGGKVIYLEKGVYTLSANAKLLGSGSIKFGVKASLGDDPASVSVISTDTSLSPNVWRRVEQTFNVTKAGNVVVYFGKASTNATNTQFGSLKLEKGYLKSTWTPAAADHAGKGDTISRINVDAGSVLISSNKLFLDSSSVTFGGSAFIPNAAIQNITADKITSGTINAGQIRVINIDANNITANRTNFIQSGWNGISSYININSSRLRAGSSGSGYIELTWNGMHVYSSYNNEEMGWIHGNSYEGHPEQNGLVFDLEAPNGDYMAWAMRDKVSDSTYQLQMELRRSNWGNKQEGLNIYSDIKFHGNIYPSDVATGYGPLKLVRGTFNGNWGTELVGANNHNNGIWFGDNGQLAIITNGHGVLLNGTKLPVDFYDGGGVNHYRQFD